MIVTPQLFSSRFFVIVTVLVSTVMSTYGITKYFELKAKNEFIQIEKQLLTSELQQMITNYDSVEASNMRLLHQLSTHQLKKQMLTDSFISILNPSRQSYKLKTDYTSPQPSDVNSTAKPVSLAISKTTKTPELKSNEHPSIHPYLNIKRNTSPQLSTSYPTKTNLIYNLEARGIKTHLNQLSSTDKASQTTYIEVNFDISKNKELKSSENDLFIQVLNPINYIIGERSSVDFNDHTLIYSKRFRISKSENNISIIIPAHKSSSSTKTDFESGTYLITIYSSNEALASTQLLLN